MNRWIVRGVLGSALSLGFGLASAAAQHSDGSAEHGQKKKALALPKCPVADEPINFAVSTATNDGPVFFCCKDCISKYKANVDKYSVKVAAQRKALVGRAKVQVTCPLSGKPVDQKVFVEHDGGKVYFCCEGCIGRFKQDPGKYKVALANSYTYQTKCPIMDEDINPQAFTTAANGMKIYYCCKGCDKKFLADPAKYAPKLVAQGFTVSPAELKHAEKDEHDEEHDHGSHGHEGHGHGG